MKQLLALFAATATVTSMATVDLSGNYEGILNDSGDYTQDLDLTIKGTVDGTTVTATIENLSGGDTVTTNELYISTNLIEGLDFKGGKYKGQNGGGLLQKKSAAVSKMTLGLDNLGGLNLSATSTDGDVSTTVGTVLGPISIQAQNVTEDSRFITASAYLAGADFNIETQDTGVGTNTAYSASILEHGVGLAGVIINVGDAAGVTQDDGILGDISDANTDSTVKGAVVTMPSAIGDITGKYIVKNDLDTYVTTLTRGAVEYGYSKTENADGIFSAELNVTF